MKIDLAKTEVIHFVGIGGIGMSGLAQIMKIMGFQVQGSDLTKNKNTETCKKIGIKILSNHSKKNVLMNCTVQVVLFTPQNPNYCASQIHFRAVSPPLLSPSPVSYKQLRAPATPQPRGGAVPSR